MPSFRPRDLCLALLLAAVVSTQLPAQLPPLTVPKGQVRFDIGGRFDFWDRAYVAGVKQDAAQEWRHDPLTGAFLPGLAQTEAALQAATGAQGLSLSLGKSSADLSVNLGTAEIGAALGVTSWLTIFGRAPIVRVRVLSQVTVDSAGATAGFNPADPRFGTAGGSTTTNAFLTELDTALGTLNSRIQSGQYAADPVRRAEAEALLSRGRSLQTALQSLLLESSFLPRTGSTPAIVLGQTIDSIRGRLLAVDSIILESSPALPAAGLAPGGLEDYVTRAGGPIEAPPFEPPVIRELGDIEVGLGLALLNGRPPIEGGIAVRSFLQGTARLPTGKIDDPNALFDVGTGDGQLDLQADLVADVMTKWVGARFSARYVLQRPHRFERRITSPGQPLVPANNLALVERDPGEIMEGAIEPYVRLARHFSFVAGVRYWRKSADQYTYAPGQDSLPGLSPAVLAQGTKENGTMLSAGLSLAHTGIRRDGRVGLPLDATIRGQMLVGSTEGRVPLRQSVVFEMRVYGKLW
ncbi:MAG: hypothetical protein ACT4PM_04940 [Gemmatimonadales bacterium]